MYRKTVHVNRRQVNRPHLLDRDAVGHDDACAERYGIIRTELELAGTPIGPNDLMIAATALAHGVTLVTSNVSEFSRVAGLRLEDWDRWPGPHSRLRPSQGAATLAPRSRSLIGRSLGLTPPSCGGGRARPAPQSAFGRTSHVRSRVPALARLILNHEVADSHGRRMVPPAAILVVS